ncbi:MAG: ECF transporter S component [Chloroflexota bacterium]
MMNQMKGSFASWTTRDLMVTVVLSLAIGIMTIPLRLATATLGITLGPIVSVPLSSYVIAGGCFVAYTVRRPLAAAISQIMAGLVLSFTMPGGFFLIALYLTHAIAIELPFAVTRYKRYDNWIMAISGGIARLLILGAAWIPAALSDLSIIYQLGLLVGAFIGGAIAGLLARVFAETLIRAEVLTLGGFEPENK